MLVTAQETIIQTLTDLGLFRTIDGWQGEVEDLIRVATKLPSAHIALGEISFGDEPTAIGTKLSLDDNVWNILITASNIRNRHSGAVECYTLIEAAVTALKMLPIADGWLWPVSAKLLYAKAGLSIYGISFVIENEQ
nr:hypothetical protein [uncultured bacterium]